MTELTVALHREWLWGFGTAVVVLGFCDAFLNLNAGAYVGISVVAVLDFLVRTWIAKRRA